MCHNKVIKPPTTYVYVYMSKLQSQFNYLQFEIAFLYISRSLHGAWSWVQNIDTTSHTNTFIFIYSTRCYYYTIPNNSNAYVFASSRVYLFGPDLQQLNVLIYVVRKKGQFNIQFKPYTAPVIKNVCLLPIYNTLPDVLHPLKHYRRFVCFLQTSVTPWTSFFGAKMRDVSKAYRIHASTSTSIDRCCYI